jgi:hypothetical protein
MSRSSPWPDSPTPDIAFRDLYPESCRAPEGGYDQLQALRIQQDLDQAELAALQGGLKDGVDSGSWAGKVLELKERLAARAVEIDALEQSPSAS